MRVVECTQGKKQSALLAMLSFYRRAHTREQLADAIWPEADQERARNSLRVALTTLRRTYSADLVADESGREAVLLSPSTTTDLDFYRALLGRARLESSLEARASLFERALELVKGPLLAGIEAEWLVGERACWLDEYFVALRGLIAWREGNGDLLGALDAARRGAVLGPTYPGAMHEAIRLAQACGQNASARIEFESWQRRLGRQGLQAPDAERISALLNPSSAPVRRKPGQSKADPSAHSAPIETLTTRGPAPGDKGGARVPFQNAAHGAASQTDSSESNVLDVAPLPLAVSSFVGRGREIEHISARLRDPKSRLITIFGPGGGGKTRLMLEIARRAKAGTLMPVSDDPANETISFDPVAWVMLANLPVAQLFPATLSDALGLPAGTSLHRLARAFETHLTRCPPGTRALLALDSCEHILVGLVPLLSELLDLAPGLCVIATSRVPLRIESEEVFELEDLQEAVELFEQRARSARPGFALGPHESETVAELCERLGGLPLSLELAAARVVLFSPAQMLESLDRFPALDWENPRPDAPPRHRSMRATIDWSVRQLPIAARRFWARLSVFRESFALEAATAVCSEPNAASLLLALRDASLLRLDTSRSQPRGVWTQALHDFAASLCTPDEREELEARHSAFYTSWLEDAIKDMSGPDAVPTLETLTLESANLLGALERLTRTNSPQALRMAASLWWFWERNGRLNQSLTAIETVLSIFDKEHSALLERAAMPGEPLSPDELQMLSWRAQVLEGVGKMANMSWDFERARAALTQALSLFERLGDRDGQGHCLYALGFGAVQTGEVEQARELCQRALELHREHADGHNAAEAIYNLSLVALMSGDYATARTMNAERLVLHRARGDRRGVAVSLENLGMAALFEGQIEAARSYFGQSLLEFEALGEQTSVARSLWGLGSALRRSGQLEMARSHFVRALEIARRTGHDWAVPFLLDSFAFLAIACAQWERAARLLGGSAFLRSQNHETMAADALRAEWQAARETVHDALGSALFEAEWTVGENLSTGALIDLALSDDSEEIAS